MNRLTDAEILTLERVLVRNNKSIKKIEFITGTRGAGNTNTADYSSDEEHISTPEELNGRSINIINPFERYECSCDEYVGIAAVVDDIVYLIIENSYSGEREIKTVELGKCYGIRTEIAYDTFGIYRITPQG